MTREEIERIGIGDLSAIAKLARTIKPLEKSGQTAGPIVRQFCKATETPDYFAPGASVSGTGERRELFAPRTSTTSAETAINPDGRGPFTVEIRHDLDEEGYGLTGNYAEVRGQIDEYNRKCQARFRSVIQQLYPTLPELWNMPAPAREEAPPRWGLDRAELYDVERKQKAQYERIASDTTQRVSVRKVAADIVMGYQVEDPRMRAAIRKHQANLAASEFSRDHSSDPSYKLALQAIINDDTVPRVIRADAQRELQNLGV